MINGDIGTTGASSTVTGFHDTTVLPYVQFTQDVSIPKLAGCRGNGERGDIYCPRDFLPRVALGCPNEGTGPAATPGTTFYVATQAAAAALAAYNTHLAGLPGGAACPGAGNGAGLTLAPGTYTCATSFG